MNENLRPRSVWLLQLALGALFLGGGAALVFLPIDTLAAALGWPGDFNPIAVRVIGALQIVAALVLVVPPATTRRPAWSASAAFLLGVWTMLELFLLLMGWHMWLAAIAIAVGAAAFAVSWVRLFRAPSPRAHA